MKEEVFITILSGLVLFNFVYVMGNPDIDWNLGIGALTGMLATIIATGIISGIQIFGSGLNPESIKIIFGVCSLLNILFQINVGGFPVGIGLINNLFNLFPSSTGLGFIVCSIISIIVLVSGLMIIIGG